MLLRIDMPGLRFEDLDLRFDPSTACLCYQPDAVDDLMAWNGIPDDLPLETDLISLSDPDAITPQGMHDLLMLCYVYWRSCGGTGNGAMEASLSAPTFVCPQRMKPLRQSHLERWTLALQSWLGLLDLHEDFESA